MKTNWREYVDEYIKNHLELQIRETVKHKQAYESSTNPSNAQLWIAIANLSKQIFEMNLRIKFLEKTLYDLIDKQVSSDLIKSKTVKKRK